MGDLNDVLHLSTIPDTHLGSLSSDASALECVQKSYAIHLLGTSVSPPFLTLVSMYPLPSLYKGDKA